MVVIDKDAVYKLIERDWPMHVNEIADKFLILPGDSGERDRISQMVVTCLADLEREDKIVVKNFEDMKIVWPVELRKPIRNFKA